MVSKPINGQCCLVAWLNSDFRPMHSSYDSKSSATASLAVHAPVQLSHYNSGFNNSLPVNTFDHSAPRMDVQVISTYSPFGVHYLPGLCRHIIATTIPLWAHDITRPTVPKSITVLRRGQSQKSCRSRPTMLLLRTSSCSYSLSTRFWPRPTPDMGIIRDPVEVIECSKHLLLQATMIGIPGMLRRVLIILRIIRRIPANMYDPSSPLNRQAPSHSLPGLSSQRW
ncbi:hypothetical protein B0H12DRAFT_158768 [Mycena haematopus]|nr:hypothetical protein B0H12DRAFT_158768 [Mycena haematopus]